MKDELFQLFAGGVRLLRALPSPPLPPLSIVKLQPGILYEYTVATWIFAFNICIDIVLYSQIFANNLYKETQFANICKQHLQWYSNTLANICIHDATSALILHLKRFANNICINIVLANICKQHLHLYFTCKYLQTTSSLILYLQIFANNICIDIALANICKQHLHWYCNCKYLQTTSALILQLQIFTNNICIDIALANICIQPLPWYSNTLENICIHDTTSALILQSQIFAFNQRIDIALAITVLVYNLCIDIALANICIQPLYWYCIYRYLVTISSLILQSQILADISSMTVAFEYMYKQISHKYWNRKKIVFNLLNTFCTLRF